MKNKIKLLFKRVLTIIYLIINFFLCVIWTIAYPLLRNRYKRTKNPKHFPSRILLNASMFVHKSIYKFIS